MGEEDGGQFGRGSGSTSSSLIEPYSPYHSELRETEAMETEAMETETMETETMGTEAVETEAAAAESPASSASTSSPAAGPRREPDWMVESVRLLWEERSFLGRAVRNGMILATVVVLLLPNHYTAVTRLMPPEPQSSTTAALMSMVAGRVGSLPGGVSDLLGTKTPGDLFVAVLHSQTVEDALINRFDLRRVYWRKYYAGARQRLMGATEIQVDVKSGVITIAVEDRDRRRSAALANAYVEELNRAVSELSTSAARRQRIFLEGRLQTAGRDLEQAEKRFSEFSSQNATLDVKEQTKALVGAAAELEGQIIAAKSEMLGLEQMYAPNNVRVRALRQKTAELERQLQRLTGSTETASTKAGEDRAGTLGSTGTGKTEGAEPLLAAASLANIYPDLRQLPLVGVRWADLYRQVKVQETIYELLTEQHEMAEIEEAKEIPTVKVLDPGELPERKSGPHRLLMILEAGLLSLAFAALWILGQERWRRVDANDPRKQVAEEIAAAAGFRWQDFRRHGFRRRFRQSGVDEAARQEQDRERDRENREGENYGERYGEHYEEDGS